MPVDQLTPIETEFVDKLENEYKILQDKIDKIGAFRFTIKGWSITVILAAAFAGASTAKIPAWLWLVPWPRDLVAKFQASFLASKLPLDHDSIAVHTTVPGKCFFAQEGSISDPTSAQALSGIEADL